MLFDTLVSILVAATLAPATAAPEASVTVPLIPLRACAPKRDGRSRERHRRAAEPRNKKHCFLHRLEILIDHTPGATRFVRTPADEPPLPNAPTACTLAPLPQMVNAPACGLYVPAQAIDSKNVLWHCSHSTTSKKGVLRSAECGSLNEREPEDFLMIARFGDGGATELR